MLDLQFICDHADEVAQNCLNRGVTVDIQKIVSLRQKRNELIAQSDKLRQEQNEIASKIPKEKDAAARQALIARGKELKELSPKSDSEQSAIEAELRTEMLKVPNLTHPDAPIGKDENESKTVRTWGDKPQFDFKPLDHVQLAEKLGLLDLEAGTRVAGHGFYYLRNEAVLLELGLIQYAVEKLVKEGFTLYTTPDVARVDVLEGIGFNPRSDAETQIYSIEKSDLCLVATAEITLGGAMKDQVLEASQLPIKCAGISHCFRTEAGAHGRATRGIYRVHQFTKVEMFGFTVNDNAESNAFQENVVRIEEELYQGLGIPYRVLDTCSGDLGGPAYRKYDLEAWMPGRGESGEYGEVTSASNCTDYQARRLNIRYRSPEQKGTQFVHTLNGTAIAVTRAIIAILENYQQADGTVIVPEALRKWVGKDRIG
jgi:seryl-tRNA synthetase